MNNVAFERGHLWNFSCLYGPIGPKLLNPCENDVQLFFSFGNIVIRVDPKSLAFFLVFF